MKIRFSYNVIEETINFSSRWSDFYKFKDGADSARDRSVVYRPEIYHMINGASKKSLQFLISKYPPSRRKKIDSELSERIKDTNKEFSVTKCDMLSNAKMEIGLN